MQILVIIIIVKKILFFMFYIVISLIRDNLWLFYSLSYILRAIIVCGRCMLVVLNFVL